MSGGLSESTVKMRRRYSSWFSSASLKKVLEQAADLIAYIFDEYGFDYCVLEHVSNIYRKGMACSNEINSQDLKTELLNLVSYTFDQYGEDPIALGFAYATQNEGFLFINKRLSCR